MTLLALLLLAASPALASKAPAGPPLPHVEIHATHTDLALKGEEKRAHLTGTVVAKQGNLLLRAIDVDVSYAKSTGVDRVIATKGVEVTQGTHVARAERAELDNAARTVTLTGDPRVWDGASLAQGKRIVLHLDDERVECFECAIDADPDALKSIDLGLSPPKAE